jgi:hypothetical protein
MYLPMYIVRVFCSCKKCKMACHLSLTRCFYTT